MRMSILRRRVLPGVVAGRSGEDRVWCSIKVETIENNPPWIGFNLPGVGVIRRLLEYLLGRHTAERRRYEYWASVQWSTCEERKVSL